MATVTDYLIKIQDLTQQNLNILKTINESFFTNKTHLKTTISGVDYAMPSFLSLENKINALRDDFENLVNAPKTGEAHFTFDGSSRVIEFKGYNNTPPHIVLPVVDKFEVKTNNVFKDFLNPTPYINFSLTEIPNDITSVAIKKVIPKNADLLNRVKEIIGDDTSVQYTWADFYKVLALYKADSDYIEYDTIQKLPLRKTIGTGTYVIESIVKDVIDENLDEYITIKLRSDINGYTKNLTYKLFDDTIDRYLSVGDQLVTYDDSAKVEITEIQSNINTITVRVLNGEYLNFVPCTDENPTDISDNSKIKFFSSIESEQDKYVQVPLEEDQYIFVAIAPLNDRMNIRAPWGGGLIVNTYSLVNSNNTQFGTYYSENVHNIGDLLSDITNMMSDSLTKYTESQFLDIIHYKPSIQTENLSVMQINDHLNNVDTIKNIRSLFTQKQNIKTQLTEIIAKVDDVNNKLSQLSFDDTTGLRTVYSNQLTEYSKTRNELNTSLNKIISEISINANNSEVPIENAKYRIRGYYDIPSDIDAVKGIKVQYRYKNVNNTSSRAKSIGEKFLFSDWNDMPGFLNPRIVSYKDGSYMFTLQDRTDGENVPSFNQIDIPISQGETVDIRLKLVYDYGYPFVEMTSDWSDVVNIAFPDEYLKDVQILDIISENNNDIETNRFENIIKEKGITSHIDDNIVDQDITYFHNPSHIASGFYTSERRVIPLKDKLEDLTNLITQLQDEISGNSATALNVSLSIGDTFTKEILPFQDNYIYPKSYGEIAGDSNQYKLDYNYSNEIVSVLINIVLKNTSSHTLKLYPLFPGDSTVDLNDSTTYKVDLYAVKGESYGVYMKYPTGNPRLQKLNQYITFCIKNPYNGDAYYGKETGDNIQTYEALPTLESAADGAVIYPYITDNLINLDNSNKMTYKILNPGEAAIIPLEAQYRLDKADSIGRTMSFDLRTSLYQDPTNYKFTVVFKKDRSTLDTISSSNNTNISYNITL